MDGFYYIAIAFLQRPWRACVSLFPGTRAISKFRTSPVYRCTIVAILAGSESEELCFVAS